MRTKRISWLIFAIITTLVALVGFDMCRTFFGHGRIGTITYNIWYRSSSYNRVKVGMTQNQVKSILGQPKSASSNESVEKWAYNMSHNTSRVVVSFGANGRVTQVWLRPIKADWPKGVPEVGMTMKQVIELGRKPSDTLRDDVYTTWKYDLWGDVHYIIGFDHQGRVIRNYMWLVS